MSRQSGDMVKQLTAPAPAAPAAEIFDDPRAAEYLVTTPRTLREWRNSRSLPFIRVTARTIRYRRSDLDAWLQRRRVAIIK